MGLEESIYLTALKTVLRRIEKNSIDLNLQNGRLECILEGYSINFVPKTGGFKIIVKKENTNEPISETSRLDKK